MSTPTLPDRAVLLEDMVMAEERHEMLKNELAATYWEDVSKATELLDFAISEGKQIDDRVVEKIVKAQDSATNGPFPPAEARAEFQETYRDLALALAPVTAGSLRATSDEHGRKAFLVAPRPISEAKLWSRKLWAWTIVFIVVALFIGSLRDVLQQFYPMDEETQGGLRFLHITSLVLGSLVPFIYGAIGALTYLLRSCHQLIHERSFNPAYIPEYYNRILLGIVSGGAIVLFIQQITTDSGVVTIGAATLGFLAGYNTDFLFTTIEKVSAALLPKVGLETLQKAQPVPIQSVSLDTLLDRLEGAKTDEERKTITALIERLKGRV